MTSTDLVVVGGRQRAPSGLRDLGDGWYGYDGGTVRAAVAHALPERSASSVRFR